MRRKKVALIFGGRSGEHMASLRSAASIMEAIDKDIYEVVLVGITREGRWFSGSDIWSALWDNRSPRHSARAALLIDPTSPGLLLQKTNTLTEWSFQPLDLAFPILHGTYGEDGTIQGLLEMAGLPYVGSDVLASSVAMDKVVMKILFQQHGLPVTPYLYFNRAEWESDNQVWLERIKGEIGFPCFVKPANLGSSVGINKVHRAAYLVEAVKEALLYDDKIIVEAHIDGRELECSVIGDIDIHVSCPGEIVPCNEFYDYKAKYLDSRTRLIIPAEIENAFVKQLKKLSIQAFRTVEACGLARVDFFLRLRDRQILVNEINTMPGFTYTSMYPKLWEASGIKYSELIDRLLKIAEERFQRRQSLLFSPPE